MTEHQDARNAAAGEGESKGCLLLLASYADVANVLEPVVTGLATRILASPMLGDFVEVRFVDVGIRSAANATSTAISRILDALVHPASGAAQNYFALAFVDQSAATASRVLEECRSDAILAALPMAYRGLAVIEDRPGRLEPSGESGSAAGGSADIVVAPSGKWTARTLTKELLWYAEQLFRRFATTHERGVSRDELAEIRDGQEDSLVLTPSDPAGEDAETDLLAVTPVLSSQVMPRPPDEAASGQGAPVALPTPLAPEPSGTPARSWQRLSRLRLAPRRMRIGKPAGSPTALAASGPGQGATAVAGPPTLISMLLYGDTNPDEQTSWRRGRSLMAKVDRGLAAARPYAFKVRAFSGKGGSVKTPLREAGCLSHHDIKRPDHSHELGQSLDRIHSVLQKDLDALERVPDPGVEPVIVIFAIEIPVADVITAEAYIALALDTTIIWVVPEGGNGLMSQTFSTSETHIITDHEEVADEVVKMVLASVTSRQTPGGQDLAGSPERPAPAAFIVTNRQGTRLQAD